ncbi:uncharacterized protein LOC129376420 [Poeciliopsis prolifica]|uniref:uncharacterized protein LOC129376420 n=1 Tax=Poeciliopsis prolifica TaxID=188132 RepID=UPI0024140296|nr:uncharacterized protein LOC129376420 [Poeciliopsis prolifica]XP_054912036.1 uncharacterized protein LOC129376420 [Poeciliopsis prolifica]
MKTTMKTMVLLLISQHALCGVVEVTVGSQSVLLPCRYSGIVPDEPVVTWTNEDAGPACVHLRREQDDLRTQDERYRGRTRMAPGALDSGDFSLTLSDPRSSDQGTYTCSLSGGRGRRTVRVSQLRVRDEQVEVKTVEGADSVVLPCRMLPNLPGDSRVEWTRSEPELVLVHTLQNTSRPGTRQDDLYCGRTHMKQDLLQSGDLSLTLQFPTARDRGRYVCTVYRGEDILRRAVVLQHVTEAFPLQAKVLLVLLLALCVSAGLIYYFRLYILSVYTVKVEAGAESVLLPCRSTVRLPEDAKVDWRTSSNMKVHVYLQGCDRSEEQHRTYRDRTRINQDPLRTRDLSLTLQRPLDVDSDTYTCIVCSREGHILLKKDVKLRVRVQQVEVKSGVESVLLPCRTKQSLDGDVKVEWKDRDNRTVHVYQNGSDQPGEQNQIYRTRTRMDGNLLKNKNLSLTLLWPSDGDAGTYSCSVSNRDGDMLMMKQVKLQITGLEQVEVEPEVDSVLLPCRTRKSLDGDVKVEWRDGLNKTVHVYQNGSDQPGEQNRSYRTRTKMDENPLRTGDLSLTLRRPTDEDNDTYTCSVSTGDGDILMKKQVKLQVKVCQVEVEDGATSVLLPFRTTPDLPADAAVVWGRIDPEPKMIVHMYYSGSDQPDDQDEHFSTRTKMADNLLTSGDLSLTLRRPTVGDSGQYESA